MERGPRSNQKLKIMYLMKILTEQTDEAHDITLAEIVEQLQAYGVSAERKSLYSDIENLRLFGMDIVGSQYDRTFHYQVVNRQFELAELKLLVDSVQSAKFITEKKSRELIKKIEGYASKYEAEKLDRQVNVAGRVKNMNERIYYSIDAVHEAISGNQQISFQYFTWTVEKKMELKHNGAIYHVSPWALCWDDEKYYLIGYDNDEKIIKHFRVDKMTNTNVVNEKRLGKTEFSKIKMTEYTSRLFGMFEGETENVRLHCENEVANIIIDRFGTNIPLIKVDPDHFEVVVSVSVSKLFLGWIMALPGVKIISPESTVNAMKEEISRLHDLYF
ncbi:MAG: WYL domain-containing protein [Lachnospiraceae bacterium]|nr:WYL domain-containing protein [Lachnospiraceae bacterium]